jgi:glycine cleavage system transcriptional repressor
MSNRQWFAIAAIGRDRPGIVADLSECVYEGGCNLEDASMTMLGNEFATLMLASGTGEDVAAKLSDACRRLEWERDLTVFLRPLDAQPPAVAGVADITHQLTAEGVDKAGIVAGVSRTLAARSIDIVDLRGRISPVPQSGTPLYTLTIRMRVPKETDVDEFNTALSEMASKLDVEVSLNDEAD